MKKTRDLLMEDYNTVSDILKVMSPDAEGYEHCVRERDNIRNELIRCDQISVENNMEKNKIDAENKREKVKNIITVSTFTAGMLYSIYGLMRTFRFDESGTITSTLGRGILNNTVPKMFKR